MILGSALIGIAITNFVVAAEGAIAPVLPVGVLGPGGPHTVPRTEARIDVDGRLDETASKPFVDSPTTTGTSTSVYPFGVGSFVRWISQYRSVDWRPSLYSDVSFPPTEEETDGFNQLLFSYKMNAQTALYVGYSDLRVGTFFQNDQPASSNGLDPVSRTLFVKIGYAGVP